MSAENLVQLTTIVNHTAEYWAEKLEVVDLSDVVDYDPVTYFHRVGDDLIRLKMKTPPSIIVRREEWEALQESLDERADS